LRLDRGVTFDGELGRDRDGDEEQADERAARARSGAEELVEVGGTIGKGGGTWPRRAF